MTRAPALPPSPRFSLSLLLTTIGLTALLTACASEEPAGGCAPPGCVDAGLDAGDRDLGGGRDLTVPDQPVTDAAHEDQSEGAPDTADLASVDALDRGDGDDSGAGEPDVLDEPDVFIDSDGDGVPDHLDAFPDDISEWADTDGDGTGDNADTDDDGDTVLDDEELAYGTDCSVSNPLSADTDDDGVRDDQDPYPRDPFPEFLLRRNDAGSIDLYLSNRDGTFEPVVQIGDAIDEDGTPLTYDLLTIGDFDGNGEMDFTAHTSILPDTESTRRFYFFWRDAKADEFIQEYIGDTDAIVAGIVTDAAADFTFDVVRLELVRDGYIASGEVIVYLNNYELASAGGTPDCVFADTAEAGCFFVRLPPIDVTSTVTGEWQARMAGQAVNLDPETDSYPDLTLITYASGGNAATDVYTMFGAASGSFAAPVSRFVHNGDASQAPANTVLFADFDGDDLGDIVVGFDDDGAPGEAWTYFGVGGGAFDDESPVLSLDLNPTDATEVGGGENLGRTASGRTFDLDFDGDYDLIVGYNHTAYAQPGETRLYMGNGDGTFGPSHTVIGPASAFAHSFAIPQRLCPTFEIGPPE